MTERSGSAPARPGDDLLIELHLLAGRVASVKLLSRRPAEASRVLEGQPAERALAAAPLLWSICSTAHSVAALSAVEAALGIVLPIQQRRAREVLALAEAVDNHAWQLCLEWPRLAALPPQPAALRSVRAVTSGLQAALFGRTPWRVPGGVELAPEAGAVLEAADALEVKLGELAGAPLPFSLELLRGAVQAANTPAMVLLARALEKSHTPDAGPSQLLPALAPAWFLARKDEPLLSRSPLFLGAPAETGALSRQQHHPLGRRRCTPGGRGRSPACSRGSSSSPRCPRSSGRWRGTSRLESPSGAALRTLRAAPALEWSRRAAACSRTW